MLQRKSDFREVKSLALDLGFETIGVTPAIPIPEALAAYKEWLGIGYHAEMQYLADHELLKLDPKTLLPSARSAIVVSLNYYQEPQTPLRIARYALGRDYHKVLRSKLKMLSKQLSCQYPGAEFRACVDSAPILERSYAHLAGLGWFGKNTMLIDSKRGSWFFIGILLTSIEFEPDQPSAGGCGTCRKCIDACPTGAIVNTNNRWQIDSRQCISYQTIEKKGELTVDTDGWVFGCDICQEVCPFNQPRESQPLRAQTTREPWFLEQRPFPSLAELADMTEEDWDPLTRASAIRRTGYEGLKRNATAAQNNLT
ncbi:MAG: tRNA epoxyqueuosine(34) reductase QueG [Armatimonadota bacterium]